MSDTQSSPAVLDYASKERVKGPALRRAMSNVTLAWFFGSIWITITSGAPYTLFAKNLGASELQFGILAAMPFLAAFLTIPGSFLIESTGQRKKIFIIALTFMRLMWIPIALVPIWMLHRHGSGVAMGLFIVMILVMQSGQAVGGPAWTAWMADIVPDRVRGHYFGRRRQWSIVSAVPAALFAGWYLDRYTHGGTTDQILWACAVLFLIASFFGTLDIQFFHWIPDVPTPPRKGEHLLRAMKGPLHNREFMWFAGFVATMTFAISFMGQFVTLYLLERAKIDSVQTQLIVIVAPAVANFFVFTAWGRAADRMGKKPLLILAALGLAPVAVGWSFLGPHNVWLGYLLSAAGAALWSGIDIANFNIILEMSSTEDGQSGTAFSAVNTLIVSLAGCAGGIASGIIAQKFRVWHWQPIESIRPIDFYDMLFILSGLLRFLAVVVFLPHMHEPEARPTVEALRFMTANIYNNLFNAVLLPLRAAGGLRRRGKNISTEKR